MADDCGRHDHEQLFEDATDILATAVADGGNPRRAAPMLHDLADKYGYDTMPAVLIIWIDALAWGMGLKLGELFTFNLQSAETGDIQSPDQAPPDVAMCGWLISARINDDKDTFVALINSIPGGRESVQVIVRVLSTCSLMIRRMLDTGTVRGLR